MHRTLLGVLCLLVLAGCTTLQGMAELKAAVEDAGYPVTSMFNRQYAMSYTHELLTEMFGKRPATHRNGTTDTNPLPIIAASCR